MKKPMIAFGMAVPALLLAACSGEEGADALATDQDGVEASTESEPELDVSDAGYQKVARCYEAKTRVGKVFSVISEVESDPARKAEIGALASKADERAGEYESILDEMMKKRQLTPEKVVEISKTAEAELDALEEGRELPEFAIEYAKAADACDAEFFPE